MSRNENPPASVIIKKYGRDALRLYLLTTVEAREHRFENDIRIKEEGIRNIIKNILQPWYNAFRFLIENIDQFERDVGEKFVLNETTFPYSLNIMDRWFVSSIELLLIFLRNEMKQDRFHNTSVPYLKKYLDNLINWYIRMNKKRFNNKEDYDDRKNALKILFLVTFITARLFASTVPFFTEYMFNWLKKNMCLENNDSIHLQRLPDPCKNLIDMSLEKAVSHMQTVIELARILRNKISAKYPLREIVVIHQNAAVLEDILLLEAYILVELNIKKLTVTADKEKYGMTLRAEPNHKTLGARLKGEFKQIMQAVRQLSDEQLQEFVATEKIVVQGYKLEEQDLRLIFNFTGPNAQKLSKQYKAHSEGSMLILLDITLDEELYNEGHSTGNDQSSTEVAKKI